MLTAYVDESASRENTDPGVYILSAVLVDDSRADDARESLDSLRKGWRRKVHWHDADGAQERLRLVTRVRELAFPALVFVTESTTVPDRVNRCCGSPMSPAARSFARGMVSRATSNCSARPSASWARNSAKPGPRQCGISRVHFRTLPQWADGTSIATATRDHQASPHRP